ncbi:MAG: hypothetical protein OS130_11410 [Thermodesulfobacteriota bacterium]|nr:MAG: hypothetical protein OS130_11410 [Thermodesulfobacteriota bacterium]
MKRKRIKERTCWSRETFSCILGRELARSERSNQIFSVVEFGIGDFETNIELGNRIFQVVAKELRSTDEVGWFKNHHIGVLLYNTSFEGARVFAERICKLLPNPPAIFGFTIHTYPIGSRIQDGGNYQVPEGRQAVLSSLFGCN